MGSDISLSKAVRANLLSLQNTAEMMNKTQNRLATGNKVNSALDNPSNFFTASALNSRAADMSNLLDSMASGIKVIEAANNGITALTKNIESMQSTLRQARQDKSFQTQSFEIGENSVINLAGGQFGDLGVSVSLADAVEAAGVKSQLSTQGTTYLGPQSTTASAQGAGARTLINYDAAAFTVGDEFTVAGVDITLTGTDIADVVSDINDALNGPTSATAGRYTVSEGTGANAGKIIIETVNPAAEAAAVDFNPAGATQTATSATKGVTTFNFANAVSGSVDIGGQVIPTGANFEEFVANLQANAAAGGYEVDFDADTGDITLTSVAYGAAAPTVSGTTATAGVTTFEIGDIDQLIADDDLVIGGIAVDLSGLSAGASAQDIVDEINGTLGIGGTVSYDADSDTFTFTTTATGAAAAAATVAGGEIANDVEVDGADSYTSVNGIAGVFTEAVEPATNEFSVSYDGKTANVTIGGMKGGIDSPYNALDVKTWQDATIASVNDQLERQGITGVEATFDEDGKFSLVAKNAEAKTLAVSGRDSVALFGTNGVNTGSAQVDGLNAIKTTDKFVELINKKFGNEVRASNDNGKLRIENLSTQDLNIGVDLNGTGTVNAIKVDGNSVRANLSKQFNELRDQLDKLADDASFNGINLLRGDKLKITFNESGTSSIDIQAKDKDGNVRGINASNLLIDTLDAEDLDTDDKIDAFLGKLQGALMELRSQASTFGSNLSSVENRQSFTKNMINTLETGAANLTLADTNEEAANLLALQTRQQLSSSALSMASQQDQAVLQLLR